MKKLFYIDYPQAHVEGKAHTYVCAFCGVLTTTINGNLHGHLASCDYRIKLEAAGFEVDCEPNEYANDIADEVD